MAMTGMRQAQHRHKKSPQKRHGNSPAKGAKDQKDLDLDESSAVIQAFRVFQNELDNRNDRNERIVKLSRDITIESKRIIFTLQRCVGSENKEDVLNEAKVKFKELHESKFFPLALELEGQDPYQYLKAFSPGLQEYVEAITFFHYVSGGNLVDIERVQSDLTFPLKTLQSSEVKTPTQSTVIDKEHDASHPINDESSQTKSQVIIPIPPSEYMLGVADFTGELMRMAINCVGARDLETPSVVLDLMRVINSAFTNFGNIPRELRQKTRVLTQSLQKVERACYTLRVRGSEIPTHMLADVFTTAGSMPSYNFNTEDMDENFD
ncbi:hypothetical protein EGW08_002594 [Elysia chlorotica]|uniref:Translin-associated protein X n=1 Tax=Elysia chlorotica TaxID=188477 RepID=A0A3S1AED3_ELYCH|nr:hypothetical protein EGW08_002594 [Elysia chlorotica]